MVCIGAQTVLATFATAVVGWGTPEEVRTYVALNKDPWDNNEQINFKEPMGTLGVEYDIHKHLRLFFEHLSSPIQCNDYPGINHAGVKVLLPIEQATVYSGISINNSDFDSNDPFSGPLVSIGLEYGPDDYKLYAEHLASIEEFSGGRTSFGVKVFFR